jgi:hypothetical protein
MIAKDVPLKGTGPKSAVFAVGGDVIQPQASRFFKTPDVFRTDIQRTDYGGKKTPGGEMSRTEGETKVLPAVKPKT